MLNFRHMSIKGKLTLLILFASTLALLLTTLGFAIYEHHALRTNAVGQLTTLAAVMGENTAASLAFHDQKTAREMLASLAEEPTVMGAALYDAQGTLFAEYRRQGQPKLFSLASTRGEGTSFENASLIVSHPLFLEKERLGSIEIVSDISGFYTKLKGYAAISVILLILSLQITILIASRVLRIVSDPIVQLAHVAQKVTAKGDYSLRVEAHTNDEIGTLVTSFNGMLTAVQQRDFALLMAKNELESRVSQRTAQLQQEVAERKQAEAKMRIARDAAEIASRAKSEFLANMSHEIRTPLNGVIGMAELLADTELSQEQTEYLNTIGYSAQTLLSVINDILDFSKVEAGKLELESIVFNLRNSLEESLKSVALKADEKGLEILCNIDASVPDQVIGDPTRLRQILLNLVGNAIKFTEEGEVSLSAQLISCFEGTTTVQFVVADTGIGIPPDKQQTIFDAFSQADTSVTRYYGGTGLGLTISARLVSMMHGKIWVESELGKGSRFYFTLQFGMTQSKNVPATLPRHDLLCGLRVLVVDDNATNRKIISTMLHGWNMRTTSVAGGEQGLKELAAALDASDAYDLILTDMHMPAMSGFDFVQEVRRRIELSTTAIMMLTSAAGPGDTERCRSLGINNYLFKPVRKSELLQAIVSSLSEVAAEPPPGLPRAPAASSVHPLNILLAEDNRVNQIVATRMIEKMGHKVAVANTGLQALNMLSSGSFELILMDVQMPEMDGFTATRRIRLRESGTPRHIPIIAITAHAMSGDREKCVQAGMDGYVSKPIGQKELADAIAQVMGWQDTPLQNSQTTRA